MNIYHVTQHRRRGWDTYSDFVCIAESEQAAKDTPPSEYGFPDKEASNNSWPTKGDESIIVELIGTALDNAIPGVVCASFHAG